MTDYIRVRNFERFQHYRDRSPPWIKLYNELLDDYEFGCLQDASKMHLVLIWLLASRTDNKIPADPKWIARRISATERVDLAPLLRAGFIEQIQELQTAEQVASIALANGKQHAIPEREGETETETEERQKGREAPLLASPAPPRQANGSRLSADWTLPEDWADWATANVPHIDVDAEAAKFLDYWIAQPGSRGRKADWAATWRNWVRRSNGGTHGGSRRRAGSGLEEIILELKHDRQFHG